jgi:hypothetical protein
LDVLRGSCGGGPGPVLPGKLNGNAGGIDEKTIAARERLQVVEAAPFVRGAGTVLDFLAQNLGPCVAVAAQEAIQVELDEEAASTIGGR